MRIAKFLAAAGIASRRKCEQIILDGRVSVNGQRVTELGMQVEPETDEVTLDRRRVQIDEERVYIILNKPVGCVSTCHDEKGRKTVLDCIGDLGTRIYPVGRLDFTTEGLLLLTNDGELANKLTHPRHEITKRYYVVIDGMLTADNVKDLQRGVFIEGGKTAPAHIKIMKATPERSEFTITIHEGRNRQVRKMLEAVGKNVVFLKRISEGEINLGNLKRGEYRFLTQEEVDYLKRL